MGVISIKINGLKSLKNIKHKSYKIRVEIKVREMVESRIYLLFRAGPTGDETQNKEKHLVSYDV